MKQYLLTHEDQKKFSPNYQKMKEEFGEDYELMRTLYNNDHINWKEYQSKISKFRHKIGRKFQRIRHDLLEIEIKLEKWDPINKKWILVTIIPGQSYTEITSEFWWQSMRGQKASGQTMAADGGTERVFFSASSDSNEEGWLNIFNNNTGSGTGTNSTVIGIMIGTSSQVFAFKDQDLIAKETTDWVYDNQLLVSDVAINGQSVEVVINRLFRNKTGGEVGINEVGLLAIMEYTAANFDSFLLERSVLPSVFNVADLTTMRAQYTLRVTAN